jgi:hypothetical protein
MKNREQRERHIGRERERERLCEAAPLGEKKQKPRLGKKLKKWGNTRFIEKTH